MTHQNVTLSNPRDRYTAAIDLAIAITLFLACSMALPVLDPILRRGRGLTGVLALAGFQFTCEGLAPLFITAMRHERLSSYGFTRRQLVRSIGLAVVLAAIYDLGMSWHTGALVWIPLRRQPATHMALAAGFPASVLGLSITVVVWGFFESFFGVFFAKKLNEAFGRSSRGWLSTGTLGFASFKGLIHFALGQGVAGFVLSFASGYAIAVIPAVTENAWGSALVQTLTDAVGRL